MLDLSHYDDCLGGQCIGGGLVFPFHQFGGGCLDLKGCEIRIFFFFNFTFLVIFM